MCFSMLLVRYIQLLVPNYNYSFMTPSKVRDPLKWSPDPEFLIVKAIVQQWLCLKHRY